jgi:hypothetical protein
MKQSKIGKGFSPTPTQDRGSASVAIDTHPGGTGAVGRGSWDGEGSSDALVASANENCASPVGAVFYEGVVAALSLRAGGNTIYWFPLCSGIGCTLCVACETFGGVGSSYC